MCRNKNRKQIDTASVPKQDAALWSGRAAHRVLLVAAIRQRRVMDVLESFPCRLLLLAKDRPKMDAVAAEIAAGNFDESFAVGKAQGSLRARDRAREVHWRALPCAFPADL